ncbi:hypothetical protein HanIR_Chr15g0751601 [Helianthus annuus]|nr:hypothetical protein HanIR_Chr15g0751601 [Helianthus annuus]
MLSKINHFNSLWKQADRIRGSGVSDLDVMNRALSDFKKKIRVVFNILRHGRSFVNMTNGQRYHCWVKIVKVRDKKRKSPDAGTPGTESPIDIPDINVDPSPTRQKGKDKRPASSSNDSQEALTEKLAQYTLLKEQEKARAIELTNIRKKREEDTIALVAEQREAVKQLMYDRDLKTFTESHDHAPPEMLAFILARKRDIAKKYIWPCNF